MFHVVLPVLALMVAAAAVMRGAHMVAHDAIRQSSILRRLGL